MIEELASIAVSRENCERNRIATEIKQFNKHMMRKQDRKESDLEEKPSISNSLNFQGEDLDYSKRIDDQRRQSLYWLTQQIQERKQADLDRINKNEEWMKKLKEIDGCVSELEKQQLNDRKQQHQEMQNINLELIKQKKDAQKAEQKREEIEEHTYFCDNHFKSIIKKEKSDINEPKHIHAENKYLFDNPTKQIETIKDNEIEKIQAIRICKKMKEQERQRKQSEIDCRDENLRLMQDQQLKNRYLNKLLGSNYIHEEFYNQFNKSSR